MINPHTKARPIQHVMHTGVSDSRKSIGNTMDELAEHSQVVMGTPEEPHARHSTVAAETDAKLSKMAPADSEANKTAAEIDSKTRMSENPQTRLSRVLSLEKQPTEKQQAAINLVHSATTSITGLGPTSEENAHAIQERKAYRMTRLESEIDGPRKANDRLECHDRLHEQPLEQQHLHDLNKHRGSHRIVIEKPHMKRSELRAIHDHDIQEQAMRAMQGAQKKARDMSERYEASQRTCRDLEKEISTLKGTVRSMQSAQMESADATRWPSQSASTIEHKLKVLLSHVRQWANRHAKLPFEELSDNQTFRTTVNGLVDRGCVADPARLLECLMRSKGMQRPGKASSLLLTAAVTCEIMQKIIGDPFFAFTGQPQEHALPADCGQALTMLLGWLKDSKSWRSSEFVSFRD